MSLRVFLGLIAATVSLHGCSLSREAITVEAGPRVDSGSVRDSGAADADATFSNDASQDGSAADATSGTCPPECFTRVVRWGRNGGLAFRDEAFSLDPCWSFRRITRELGGPDAVTCEVDLALAGMAACGIANAVRSPFEHPDVRAAVAASPVVFGVDSRPVDGQVFRIEIDGAIIDVGSPCDPRRPPPLGGPCEAIPEGVAALVGALEVFQGEVVDAYCMP